MPLSNPKAAASVRSFIKSSSWLIIAFMTLSLDLQLVVLSTLNAIFIAYTI
jgi:hypothetical protein